MKKILSVVLSVVLTLTLSFTCHAAGSSEPANQQSVDAIVISSSYNADKDKFSFCVVADLSEFGYPNSEAEPFTFGVSRADYLNNTNGDTVYESFSADDEIEPGTVITVYWDGMFMETYPMQLGNVYNVVDTNTVYDFGEGEYEEYYLMFYDELPDSYAYGDTDDYIDCDTDDEIYDENPNTGLNPMNKVLTCAAILSVVTVAIYLLTALRSKSN